MRRERPILSRFRRAAWAMGLAVLACGCSSSPQATSPTTNGTTSSTDPPPAGGKNDARSRLQGTWELVTFVSTGAMPDEAVPVLSRLQGAVRLRFEGATLTTFIPGKSEDESGSFEITDESGDAFTLVTTVGMFRRAQARFMSNDTWEATENGPTWPGTTRFQRVKK